MNKHFDSSLEPEPGLSPDRSDRGAIDGLANAPPQASKGQAGQGQTSQSPVLWIVEQTERHLLAGLPVRPHRQELAKAVGVSVADLHGAFRTVRGVPLHSALIRLRLDAADRLLQSGVGSPRDAALRCGFAHFGVFKRHYRVCFGREPESVVAGETGDGAEDKAR